MVLRREIRSQRVQEKTKRPFEPRLFDRVGLVVRSFGLGDDFLQILDNLGAGPAPEEYRFRGPRRKGRLEPLLFALLTQEEYRVAVGIMERVPNPYLAFSASPYEILLSGPLFRLNPGLEAESLARHHFETLLMAEISRKGPGEPGRGATENGRGARDNSEEESERVKFIEKWIDDLETLLK